MTLDVASFRQLASSVPSIRLGTKEMRRIPLPLKLDCLSVASYHGGTRSRGEVVFRQIALPDVTDRHLVLLDDILESGTTLSAIYHKLESVSPRSVRICVLLRKLKQREHAVAADYVGFDIADEFVVGYGLDYAEHIATCLASACYARNW